MLSFRYSIKLLTIPRYDLVYPFNEELCYQREDGLILENIYRVYFSVSFLVLLGV